MTQSVSDAAFYESRHLSAPKEERLCETVAELSAGLEELARAKTPWQLLGDGQHTRRQIDKKATLLRTEKLNRIVEISHTSGLVRVEAGMRWKDLRQALRAEGLSLQRYGLHPASATVGGLLARKRPAPQALRGGEVLDGCVAMSAYGPATGEYRYLTAPRKASGPDLRYHFLGAEGRHGAILDATLVVWRPVAERLLRWEDCSFQRAHSIMAALFRASLLPQTVHYSYKRRTLQLTLVAPGRLLRIHSRWLSEKVGAPTETGDEEIARTRRDWLEARHPDRRIHPQAENTQAVWLSAGAFSHEPKKLFGDTLDDIEIVSWTPQRAEAFVRLKKKGRAKDIKTLPENTYWAQWPLL